MLEASSQYMRLAVSEINGSNPVWSQTKTIFISLAYPILLQQAEWGM